MNKNRIVHVVGTDYEPNFGDQAIFATMANNLRATIPGVQLVVHSQNPKGTQLLIGKYLSHNDSVKQSAINHHTFPWPFGQKHSHGTIVNDFERYLEKIKAESDVSDIAAGDAIMLVGGGSKISEGENDVYFNLAYLSLGAQFGKPVFLYMQSVTAPRSSAFSRLCASVLNKSSLILLREHFSRSILEGIGVDPSVLDVAPDSAFGLIPKSDVSDELQSEGIPQNSKPLIGICAGSLPPVSWQHPRSWLVRRRYCTAIASLADRLIKSKNAHIVFLHSRGRMSSRYSDDSEFSKFISSKMRCPEFTIIRNDYDCEVLAGICAHLDLLIGYRMHSLIFALINAVPVVPISMYHKTQGVLDSILYPYAALPMRKCRYGSIRRLTEDVWSNRESIRDHLHGVIPQLQVHISQCCQRMSNIINQNGFL
jgi:polysaccharide pyruvyl transferase WcaK-like protein